MKNLLTTIVVLLVTITGVHAQGTIRGQMYDAEFQEPIIGGVVKIEGTSNGAVTDLDGQYSIQVPAGTYNVIHSYVGYTDKKVTGVVVTDGEVVSLGQVIIGDDGGGAEIEEVVITVETQKNSEEGLLTFQMNNTKIVDAVSAQSIAKTGDSDVAAVVKRVPGVTIEGGKYVYVRGLGDRYSKSILNGLEIPGLDPNKNAVQLDIFPSNIIDNIVVYKTFSPDLAGDFTGGMVDVSTKDFPLEKTMKVSSSLGYNTVTTFNDKFINAEAKSFGDILGFGKSSRVLPFDKNLESSSLDDASLFNATNALNKEVNPKNIDNFLNQNLSLSFGNQVDLSEKYALGFNAAVSYKNNYTFKDNVKRNNFVINPKTATESYKMSANDARTGIEGYNEGLLNGLLAFALKDDKNKYSLKMLHTRTGESSANKRSNVDSFNDQNVQETTLDYFQRTLTNGILSGEHFFDNKMDIDWGVSATASSVDNPDRSSTVMEYAEDSNDLKFTSGATNFNKQWRELSENNVNGKVNLEIPVGESNASSVKFGGAYGTKKRDFETYTVSIGKSTGFDGSLITIKDGDLDQLLKTENIVNTGKNGYEIGSVIIDAANKFTADMSVLAGYGMTDYKFTDKLKFIGGLRVENAVMNYDGQISDAAGTTKRFDGESLNSTQLLPSANFVFEPIDFMNVRASYNRTLARPSFKEKSGAIIYDAINDQRFYGNIDLVETTVNNFDLRWEYFYTEKEMLSVSPFYKTFEKPIELSFVTSNEVKPFNKKDATVYGFEIEAKKNLGFIGEFGEQMSVNSNFTFVKSTIPLSDNEKIKYTTNGLSVPKNRDMLGQSPFSVNAGLGYKGTENGLEANLSYNVKGKTLRIVGIADIADVYEDPFHNLDFKVSKVLGGQKRSKFSLTAKNIMNDNVELYYQFPGVDSKATIYNSYDIGQLFSLGYSYKFFGE